MYGKLDFLGFDHETGKFIFALKANAGKLTCVIFNSLIMRSICWPSLENEAGEDHDMMKNISRENDDFRLENIYSREAPYASRRAPEALWRPRELILMTFWHVKVGACLAENVVEFMLGWCFRWISACME